MKTFRSLVVLKRPHAELWTIMRDHLAEIAPQIADIQEVRQLERTVDADGVVHIVNRWRVRHQVPPMIRSMLKAGELSWIDRNSWDARTFTCSWSIEPELPDRPYRLFRQDCLRNGDGRTGRQGDVRGWPRA